jgi:hypothetical protein
VQTSDPMWDQSVATHHPTTMDLLLDSSSRSSISSDSSSTDHDGATTTCGNGNENGKWDDNEYQVKPHDAGSKRKKRRSDNSGQYPIPRNGTSASISASIPGTITTLATTANKGDDDQFTTEEMSGTTGLLETKRKRVSSSLSPPPPTTLRIVSKHDVASTHFVRSIPHQRGHWSGHVRVSFPLELFRNGKEADGNDHSSSPTVLDRAMVQIQKRLLNHRKRDHHVNHDKNDNNSNSNNRFNHSVLVQHEALHLSLSRPFSLHLNFVESFVQQLSNKVVLELQQQQQHQQRGGKLGQTPLTNRIGSSTVLAVDTSNIILLVNDEQTRSFFSWTIRPMVALLRLVQDVDAVLKQYQQPTYYDPPTFHVSFASMVGNVQEEWKNNHYNNETEEVDEEDDKDDESGNESDTFSEPPDVMYLPLNQLECTFGTTKKYVIDLGTGSIRTVAP